MDRSPGRIRLTFATSISELGLDQSGLHRAVRSGALVRVLRGAYAGSDSWTELPLDERHRHRVFAAAHATRDATVFSHHAAAALWRLPILGSWPERVDVTTDRRSGGRSSGSIRRHCLGIDADDLRMVDGLWTTSPAKTAVDLAKILPFPEGVAVMDAAAHRKRRPRLATLEELRTRARAEEGRRGWRRAVAAADFATDLSDSPWESASRVQIHLLGFPAPVLQQRFPRHSGGYDEADFWWPEYGVLGEFDGMVKYLSNRYRQGLSAEQVVVKEKVREDRLRRGGRSVARWIVPDVRAPERLARILTDAGLPRRR